MTLPGISSAPRSGVDLAPTAPDRRRDLRDRRGRGRRGPDLMPGPLAPQGVPRDRTPGERFDLLAVAVLDDIEQRCQGRLPPVDLAVEEIPVLPTDWSGDRVPLGSLVSRTQVSRDRVVLFRRPIEHRADGAEELAALILAVLVDQVAELLGVSPCEVHPDYPAEE